jgi:hypothetical protein
MCCYNMIHEAVVDRFRAGVMGVQGTAGAAGRGKGEAAARMLHPIQTIILIAECGMVW